MLPIMSCIAGNTVGDCTAYTEQFYDQILTAHNNFKSTENQLFLLFLVVGILLGFLITYLIIYFYNL